MHGQAVRGKRLDRRERGAKIRRRLARQRRDDIHVDVVKPHPARQMERVLCLLARVRAPDHEKRLVAHGLGVDGDARDARGAHRGKLVPVDRTGPAGSTVHSRTPGNSDFARDRSRLLPYRQRGRRAAPDGQRGQKPGSGNDACCGVHLLKQLQGTAPPFPAADRFRKERAACAPRAARMPT